MHHSLRPFYLACLAALPALASAQPLQLHEKEYFETQGLNVLVFSNWYDGLFSDSKISGIELIHHGERTVTNGDVRLNATPEQWDPIPTFVDRSIDPNGRWIEARLKYPSRNFDYAIRATANDDGSVTLSVSSTQPLPANLVGKAGFNLEFLPTAYFGKSYRADTAIGQFPLYPSGPMAFDADGQTEPLPLATARDLTLASESDLRRVRIQSPNADIQLYDGRNKAQNGWFVARSLLPANQTGVLLEWRLSAHAIPNWIRPPVIGFSQVGYHPQQSKVAVIELDARDPASAPAKLVQIGPDGSRTEILTASPLIWGMYKRYRYAQFDFSSVADQGLYQIEYAGQTTPAFPIADDVYDKVWQPTLDIFMPVQMDHLLVNEAYRVWHGASHLDDARQAPINHEHFDLYAQGPTTDTAYQPGQHIPGLNVGGWYDAGDYDIRTQTQYFAVRHLVYAAETFAIDRDNTLVDYDRRFVDLHHPDGKPDILQQIEHGAIALLAQHCAVGHAIPGIVEAYISQYTHLGDGLTKTDNLVCDPALGELETDGFRSGVPDDRWAFTSRSSALNYGSAAGLAAASRALKTYQPDFAAECLATALAVWNEEQGREPFLFRHGNTTGGNLQEEELQAACELLLATGEPRFAERMIALWPTTKERFENVAATYLRALPQLGDSFKADLRAAAVAYKATVEELKQKNPYGVPITEGGWAGSGAVVRFGINNHLLRQAFPDLFDADDVYRSLNYIFGCHPYHNRSLVSAVGAQSKDVAYGTNRADYSFIAGGVVPGILILKPDFPENKNDWPFLWGENEYVISVATSYLYLANAVAGLH